MGKEIILYQSSEYQLPLAIAKTQASALSPVSCGASCVEGILPEHLPLRAHSKHCPRRCHFDLKRNRTHHFVAFCLTLASSNNQVLFIKAKKSKMFAGCDRR